MRAFFGIPCPDRIREALTPLQKEIESDTNLKPVKPGNFHLTIKFLGEVSTSDREDLDSLIQSRLPTPGPLKLVVKNVGVFPNMDHPSVVWAGIDLNDSLRAVYEAVEDLSTDLGFDPDEHEFRPHVTLGRYKNSVGNTNRLLKWIQDHGEEEFGRFEASFLHLYESDLQQDGPIYTSMVSWPL